MGLTKVQPTYATCTVSGCCDIAKKQSEPFQVAMQANKAVVQDLKRQLAEQRNKSGAESAAQLSQIDVLQQSLAAKSQQLDKLAADRKNALEVGFHLCTHAL